MSDERTEAATPRKRNEVRRRGQVAKSQDLSSMIVLLAVLTTMHAVGGRSVEVVLSYLQQSLIHRPPTAINTQILWTEAGKVVGVLLRAIGPLFATAMLVGMLVNMLQTRFLFATQALMPSFNRLNPLLGIKRFISAQGLVEAVKASAKLFLISLIAYKAIDSRYPEIVDTIRKDIPTIIALTGDLLYRVTLRVAMFLLLLGAIDYGYQRYSFEKSNRMSKDEVKREGKESEGNPEVKNKIRQRMRQAAKRRMMQSVPTADVVVTNPTHFAVALKYDPDAMGAPLVVAKGADLVAAKIRELAQENDVPIVENPPLARTLYKSVEIGQEIPGDMFGAVAEVLAYVYSINRRRTPVPTGR